MTRFLVFSCIALAACCGIAAILGAPVIHGYFAAWLICLSVPVGALPITLGLELAGQGSSKQTGLLRWMLTALPVLALAGTPVFLFQGNLYPWVAHRPPGFAGVWFTPFLFAFRGASYLLVWSILAWLSVRPPGNRPRVLLCSLGLGLHAALGTMAATDWVISLSPGFSAAGFGLLFMAGQSALAVTVALAFARVWPPIMLGLAASCVLAWVVLNFTQYLIIWSANLPAEITWYLRREGIFGPLAACLDVAACALVLWLQVTRASGASSWLRTASMIFIAIAQLAGLLWLVIPAQSSGTLLPVTDAAVAAGVIVLFTGLFWAIHPRGVQA